MPNIHESDCICLPCVKHIKRNCNNPGFTPRWLPKPKKTGKCTIELCEDTVFTETNQVTADELEHILRKRVHSFTVSTCTSRQSIGLCKQHYNQMYVTLNHAAPCDLCGTRPKRGEVFSRHCPSPTIVNEYIHELHIK